MNKVHLPHQLQCYLGPGNDYSFITRMFDSTLQSGIQYAKGVSVVITVYNRKAILEKTLAALIHQTYPKELIEVIVTDDGSNDNVEKEVVQKFRKDFDLKFVTQQHVGYRPGQARNRGIKLAKNDYIILLDCDMLPLPGLVEEHMKYFHIYDSVVTIGHRRFVNSDELTAERIRNKIDVASSLPDIVTANEIVRTKEIKSPTLDWRLEIYKRTNNLKKEAIPFRSFCSGNVAFNKELGIKAGLFDESFSKWGNEDGEFGFRLYQLGLYFIPVLSAIGLHQEHPIDETRKSRTEDNFETTKLRDEKVPLLRKYKRKKIYEVPTVSFLVPVFDSVNFIEQEVESILKQKYTDLEILIFGDKLNDSAVEILRENYLDDPRIKWIEVTESNEENNKRFVRNICRGVYICEIPSKCVLKRNSIETMIDSLNETPEVGCVYTPIQTIKEDGNSTNSSSNISQMAEYFLMYRKRDWSRFDIQGKDIGPTNGSNLLEKLNEVCNLKYVDQVLCTYQKETQAKNLDISTSEIESRINPIAQSAILGISKIGISVIICTHNRASYLVRSIENITNQTLQKELYEIIIVDNRSTDNTKNIVFNFIFEGYNIKYFLEPKLGLSNARNRGIYESKFKYLIFLDDDAFASKDLLKLYFDAFTKIETPPACIAGKIILDYEVPKPKWFPQNPGFEKSLTYLNYGDKDRFLQYANYEYPYGANMGIVKSFLLDIGGFDSNLGRKGGNLLSGEESKVFYDLYKNGKSIYYLHNAYVNHLVPKERLTKKFFYKRFYWYGITMAVWRPDIWAMPPQTITGNVKQFIMSIYGIIKKKDNSEKFLKACDMCFHAGFIFERIFRKHSL